MALYLGEEKLATSNTIYVEMPVPTSNCKSGIVTSDEDGIVTFPELDFTPNLIALWSVKKVDLKAEAEAAGDEWEDGWLQYMYVGCMFMGVYHDNTWITQSAASESGTMFISNESFSVGSMVSVEDGRYTYRLARDISDRHCFADVTFNYAIYG